MAKPPAIHQTYYFSVPPARVFAALTEPAQLKKWFVKRAVVTLRKGGAFRLSWNGGYSMRGNVLLSEPPRTLHVAWKDRLDGGRLFETEARFTIAKKGRGTTLSLTHRGFKSGKKWISLYGAVQSGWAYYLTNLKSVLDHGTDLRSAADQLG
jgi:uncharacterized protein YndB with AHSA1/START domain